MGIRAALALSPTRSKVIRAAVLGALTVVLIVAVAVVAGHRRGSVGAASGVGTISADARAASLVPRSAAPAVATPGAVASARPTTPTTSGSTTRAAQPAPAAATTGPSWNSHVSCSATLTTIERVLGNQRSSLGGATFAGGGFKPGIPDRRDITPPCSVSGVPTLVEIHRVTFGSCKQINRDGDWTCELHDNSATSVPPDMRTIHCEIDGNLFAAHWAPAIPPGGKLLDVQGFVFWDPGHTTASWHHFSGWELHTFTAWRLAR